MVITGMESLSRNSDVDNMMMYFEDLSLLAQLPEMVQAYIKVPEIMALLGTARSVNYQTFMKSEEQVQAEQKELQERAVAQQAAVDENSAAAKASQQPQ